MQELFFDITQEIFYKPVQILVLYFGQLEMNGYIHVVTLIFESSPIVVTTDVVTTVHESDVCV
jgi:hypothetical protein